MLEAIKTYINAHYGSRRGLLNHYLFGIQYYLGTFNRYKKIDWAAVDRLIFICHGNICRSPLAEYVAQSKGVVAESFGLGCGTEFPADPRAIGFSADIGLDLSKHRTRNFSAYVARKGDLIVAMEPAHLPGISVRGVEAAQVTLAGLWLKPPNPYIHDPFGGGEVFFANCESIVARAAENIATQAKAEGA